ncbi:cysteine dioxygenase family protein [Dactylosporangium vinaceum]|uniref:Cysteine dioxygenase family protein n=1 Tax=Dactylosporangium vinaceum TaxID=53362 RepID=A0ABV5LYR9_9ACTN|nr:cysteine dioxygenase family protein [Dactylosporangium vinaceum]UAB95257.1 cysteine dioxygenase family protein [Dactylosporangium vinaceum]
MSLVNTVARPTDLLALARDYAAEPDEWPFAPRFDPARRWYGRLAAAPDHEVWLLTWLPGQGTDLHDHGGSAGAFTVVSGELVEQTVSGGELVSRVYREGQGHRFGAHFVHRIVNAGTRPAVTVHVYGPALTAMTRYRLHDGRLSVESITKAGADW